MNPEPTIAFLDSIGGGEILMIFVVILLLFGPKRLPEMARMLGRTSAQFQKAFQEFKDMLMKAEQAAEAENPLDRKSAPDTEPAREKEPPAALPEEYADHPQPGNEAPDRSGAPDKPEEPEPPRAG
jgi:sec-independent protein translocase protein TatA